MKNSDNIAYLDAHNNKNPEKTDQKQEHIKSKNDYFKSLKRIKELQNLISIEERQLYSYLEQQLLEKS